MSASAFTLPVDIPWTRLCASEDMIDREVCDRRFPGRWHSSLAVFSYEPPEEDQEYPDQIVSYLKVAATITGYQPDPDEVGLSDRRVDSYWNDPAVIENYTDVVSRYYGCYGAILEVSIGPPASRAPSFRRSGLDYPYFADFEPKKRELYETVSETGETLSRSLDQLNVRDGMTTTDHHERVDMLTGVQGQASVAGTGGGFGVTGQWGTKDMTQEEYSNVRTSDQAQEQRETYSHTTQLSQMYHQLSSYHLGTNRAVFFLLPRPHIVESPLTFVNGPRLLEGIQELFLVVVRPKQMENFCVDAYLETAHIASEPHYRYETSVGTRPLHVELQAREPSGSLGDDSQTTYEEKSETYLPPSGWEIDVNRDGGYRIDSVSGEQIEGYAVTEVAPDHLTVWGKVSAYFEDRQWPDANREFDGRLDLVVTVYIRRTKPEVDGYSQNLWLTGRGVCCCKDKPSPLLRESINWEAPLPVGVRGQIGGRDQIDVPSANLIRREVGRLMMESMHHPDRYPFGQVQFPDTKFLGRAVARLVRREDHPDNVPVGKIKGLKRSLARKVAKFAPDVSRGRLLQMPLEEQMDRFGLEEQEAIELRRAVLGLAGEAPTGASRWEPPKARRRRSAK